MINSTTGKPFSRRALLAGSTGLAGAALLASCGPGGDSDGGGAPAPEQSAEARLPNYIPIEGVPVDIEPPNEYCLPGFLRYPEDPISVVPEKPGDGTQTVTAFSQTSISKSPPMEQNQWWMNANEKTGITFDISWAKGTEYVAKVQTMIAGDDLPEVMSLPQLPEMDRLLEAKFADITEFVAGDAIAEYPGLANFGTPAWQAATFHGAIRGVSRPAGAISYRVEARTDTLEEMGVEPTFSNGEEFLDLCREITNRDAGIFAMRQPTAVSLKAMFSLPNEWEQTDAGFVHEVESPRFTEYLEFVSGMWSEGLFHPESFVNSNRMPEFQKPSFLLYEVGGAGFTRAMPLYKPGAPTLTVQPVIMPKVEGGGTAPTRLTLSGSSLYAIRQGLDPDRVKLILRLLNYFASPFGTAEYLVVQYGKEGHDFTIDADRQIVPTANAANEIFPITLFPGTPQFNYSAGYPEVVEAECAYEAEASKVTVENAAEGLFSQTANDKSAQLTRLITQEVSDIIQGRKEVSTWPSVVEEWAKDGGDEIRKEYEEAAANQ
ncbi:hypothetical protein [Microlunatus sp. Y2014]|uniref:hypothetical protein n=1 Tax=Microlunatus sp. Y2014 TaxID=3418488 RepID=UPI003DA6E9BC